MRLKYRTIQIIAHASVVILMGVSTIFTGISFISDTVVKEAKVRVQLNLNSAWFAFNEEIARLQTAVVLASQYQLLRNTLTNPVATKTVFEQIEHHKEKYGLDYLHLLNIHGKIISAKDKKTGTRDDIIIARALKGETAYGTLLLPVEQLLLEGQELVDRAYIPLVQTRHALPTSKSEENRGMVIEAAIPILGTDNHVMGVVYGGILLNRKYELVDIIRTSAFGINTYKGKPLGTVTIFLEDVRIATNVIKLDSTRAVGTRVSEEVYNQVLIQGERFADRAFVVNDWYLSAYDPIYDPDDNIIGILYVGLLEKKYLDYKITLTYEFIGIGFLAILISLGLALYLAGYIRRPILNLVSATKGISAGELTTRVSESEGSLEIQQLAHAFNHMVSSLESRTKELQIATKELQEAYHKADEKNRAYMEMLGFVTHELKSPLASIVFTINSLRDHILGSLNHPQETILKAASNSADYLNATIANFLNLTRIEEGELKIKTATIPFRKTVIDPVLQRLSELASDKKMRITCAVPADLEITCDPDLLISVFQNLVSNAVKYGRQGGKINIDLQESHKQYMFTIYNEGSGFGVEEVENLFTKFSRFNSEYYGTKSGTGLGLFVTREIIKKHGGEIWGESEKGTWAKFTFTIPKKGRKKPH
jgi:two-component system NtrC family sensor kinase